jgi:hypothetical protein
MRGGRARGVRRLADRTVVEAVDRQRSHPLEA